MATILCPRIGVLCVLAAWRENMIFMLTENAIAKEIVDAAYRVRATLGPGLLEPVYDAVLAFELTRRGLHTSPASSRSR